MLPLFAFLSSKVGRWARAVAGLMMISLGLFGIGNTAGTALAVIGLVPLAAGVLDGCLFARLTALPSNGPALRSEIERRLAPRAARS